MDMEYILNIFSLILSLGIVFMLGVEAMINPFQKNQKNRKEKNEN